MIKISDDTKAEIAEIIVEAIQNALDAEENLQISQRFTGTLRAMVKDRLTVMVTLD